MIIDWYKIDKERELALKKITDINSTYYSDAEKAKTSVGERKMRSALITSLLELHEDKKYDIAASLAANIGYKLVEIEPTIGLVPATVAYGEIKVNRKRWESVEDFQKRINAWIDAQDARAGELKRLRIDSIQFTQIVGQTSAVVLYHFERVEQL